LRLKGVVGLRISVAVSRDGARVCLDLRGRIAGALGDFVRRHTGSDDF